jgi:hypothetical protein
MIEGVRAEMNEDGWGEVDFVRFALHGCDGQYAIDALTLESILGFGRSARRP